jgi:hypothetical protein
MIHDHRARAHGDVEGSVRSGPKLTSEFSGSEPQWILFCYTASENAASQITDLLAALLLIEKPE